MPNSHIDRVGARATVMPVILRHLPPAQKSSESHPAQEHY